jgi:transcriptional regulator with XRE-family HTH domain
VVLNICNQKKIRFLERVFFMSKVNRVALDTDSIFVRRFKGLIGVTKKLGEVAKELDVSRPTISNWLQGICVPNQAAALRIAEHYNVSVNWLQGISDNPTTDTSVEAICNYTGLSQEAIEALHNYNTNNNPNYLLLPEWINDNRAVMSQLFELSIIQDIVYNTFGLMQASDIQIHHEMDYTAFMDNDKDCDIGKLKLFETFERIVNTFDRRVTEKDKYTALKQKHDQLRAEQIRNGFDRLASIFNDDNKREQFIEHIQEKRKHIKENKEGE